ncbi:DNA/RNA non-specific endonuclease [gut metagenome]|uniref:DNA/RNA non-specific endonuclease n=1 Tax=gut metagenome TaxID=749906 RepID=J9GJQ2_9ZZZZ
MGMISKLIGSVLIVGGGYLATNLGRIQNRMDEWTNQFKPETLLNEIKEKKVIQNTINSFRENREQQQGRNYEMPGSLKHTPERLISHTGFTLSFNRIHNQPNWVAWELTKQETNGHLQRSNDFEPDPLVPLPHRVTTEDYKGSGYDRGHMVPAADMKWSAAAMNDCFYMSNICPQNHSLNSGPWAVLEKACRRWAQQEGKIYIVCGPVFKGNKQKKIGKEHRVTVPDGFFKVVLSMKPNKEKAIGFYYSNRGGKQQMPQCATTVDAIEELTGIDFFVNVPDKLEKRIEAKYSLKDWK